MTLAIDVVVRTQGDASRSKLLLRALDSIQEQNGIQARPIVVVNGSNFDDATMAALERRPDIILHYEQQASAGVAFAAGRKLVEAPFFSYLDDDDQLIEGSLLEPIQWLLSHPDCDVLINNGYFVKNGDVLVESTNLARHIAEPGVGLLDECWLSPGASIFRTTSIPPSMLKPDWSHLEWTRLAFELCAEGKRLCFLDVKTVRYSDTPGSLSKQLQHQEAALDLLREVGSDTRLHPTLRRGVFRKYLRTLHNLAASYRKHGQIGRAWRCHLESLRPPYTFKYLLYSRKLLWPFGQRKEAQTADVDVRNPR